MVKGTLARGNRADRKPADRHGFAFLTQRLAAGPGEGSADHLRMYCTYFGCRRVDLTLELRHGRAI
jgi:hypothetical protein